MYTTQLNTSGQFIELQEGLYKFMQLNGLALTDIDYEDTSIEQKEFIFKLVLQLVDNSVLKSG